MDSEVTTLINQIIPKNFRRNKKHKKKGAEKFSAVKKKWLIDWLIDSEKEFFFGFHVENKINRRSSMKTSQDRKKGMIYLLNIQNWFVQENSTLIFGIEKFSKIA